MHESTQVQTLHQELAQTSRMFEEKIRELSMARRIGDSLKYAGDARRAFETIIDTLLDETRAENCSLMLLDRETGELNIRAARGKSDPTVKYYHLADSSRRYFRLGEGVAGWVAQHGLPISIPDVSIDSRFTPSPQPTSFIGSLLCQPLTVEDGVVGVVNLSHPRPSAFTARDEQLMAVIASQVAATLNSVQVFDEMQQLNASLKLEIERATEAMARVNSDLKAEISERRRAEEALRKVHDELENRVQERTSDLSSANVMLKEQIAERLRAEEALRESNLRLQETLTELRQTQQQIVRQERLRALGQMASGIAHDFNNALSPIMGFSELLLITPETLNDQEKTKRYLQRIHTSARDAAGLVKRLSEFYRPHEENESFFPVRLNGLVMEVIFLTKPKWRDQALARGVTIDVETDLQKGSLIAGDEARLREMLTNLVFNAVDAISHEGTITLRTHSDGERVTLEVSDTGMGMTDEVRQRCLEPFFTTKGEGGTGMGMAMVHGIVLQHNGQIDIQSEPGKGTTIAIRLPVQGMRRAEAGPQETHVKLRPLHVLVVDDEPLIADLVAEYLAVEGCSTEVAFGGQEGLEKLQKNRFDLVVTDRAMPEMSGDLVAAAAKKILPGVSVLMLTGFADRMLASGENPEDVDFILGKPVSHAALREVLVKVGAKKGEGEAPQTGGRC